MTIDFYDDVLMPFVFGFAVVFALFIVGLLLYGIFIGNLLATAFALLLLSTWAIGFPLWRKYRYG